MSFMKRGLVAAMEDDTPEVVPEVPVETVPETTAEVEADSAAIAEQVGEIDQFDSAVSEAETDAGTISEIQETLQESVDEGEGVSEATAEVAEIAVEAICARLGMKPGKKTMPSLESFGNKSSRLSATQYAIESMGEKVKQIWDSILKALKMVWEKIQAFLQGFVKNRAKMKEHLQNLKKAVDAAEENSAAAAVTGGAAKAVSVGGKADASTAEEILKSGSDLVKAVGEISAATTGMVAKLTTDMDSEAFSSLTNQYSQKVEEAKAIFTDNFANGISIVSKEVTVFGKAFKVISVERAKSAEPAKEAAALSKAQMGSLLDKAIVAIDGLMTFEKVEKDQALVVKKCQELVAAYIKTAGKSEAGGQSESSKEMQKFVSGLNKSAASLGSQVPSLAYQGVKAVADYVAASLAAHGKKAEAKPAEAAKEEPKAE